MEMNAETSDALVALLKNKVAPTNVRIATMMRKIEVHSGDSAELIFAAIRALVANMMFKVAKELSGLQALEVWRSMQLVETGAPLASVPRALLQKAMSFNRYPLARKLVEQKALAHERAVSERSTIDSVASHL